MINHNLENYLEARYKQLKTSAGKDKFYEEKQALNLALISAILDSGKINPITANSMRASINSNESDDRKMKYVNAATTVYGHCDDNVKYALELSVAERKQVIFDILNVNGLSSDRQKMLDKIEYDEWSLSSQYGRGNDLSSIRQTLATRIAGTISRDFAQRLGEELIAGSHINKIKDLIDNEPENYPAHDQNAVIPSASTSSAAPVRHDPAIFGGSVGFLSDSATSHLTTTTAATATTTTTATLPVTTTTTTTATTTTVPKPARATNGNSGISADSLSKNSGQQILADFGYSLSLQKKNPKKWKEAAKLVEKFYKHCAPQPGSCRGQLMQLRASTLKDSTNALSMISLISKKDKEVGARLAFEKNISPNTDKALSKAILGHSEGYAQRHPELLAGSSPVSTRTTVDMIRPDGSIVTPTVLCVSSPALGKNGAELATYLLPDGRLNTDLYAKARQAITDQVIVNVRSLNANNERKRVVLSAAGMGEFIAGLSKEDAASATKLAAKEMADLITQLGKDKVSVVYTDKDDQGAFWRQVNEYLDEGARPAFVGALPGNWVDDNDLIVNSTSGFYQPGHGGQAGKSLDGQFGDTLLFDAHMLRSIFHSVGLRPADLAE